METYRDLEGLLEAIAKSGLTGDDRYLEDDGVSIRIVEGDRQTKGAPRKYDWDSYALDLSYYFRLRTAKPRWRQIARLLHFAGHESFPGVVDEGEHGRDEESERTLHDEINKLTKRVRKLTQGEDYVTQLGSLMWSLERSYECRSLPNPPEMSWEEL